MIEFWVEGKPEPQGSKTNMPVTNRYGKVVGVNMVEDNKRVRPWREKVAVLAHQAMTGHVKAVGAVRLELLFVMPRPKATPKSRTPHAVKKPDLDKCARAICDALTGVAFVDDSQVVALWCTKRIAGEYEQAGVAITVKPLA